MTSSSDTGLVTNIIPYGMGPSPRRRVGMCLMGSEIVICGGVGLVDEDTGAMTSN